MAPNKRGSTSPSLARCWLAALVLPVGLTALPAAAQDKPFYIGAAGNYGRFEVECPGATCDDPDQTGARLYAGWNFHPIFGAELTYADFGAAETDVVTSTSRTVARLDVQALSLALTARYRLDVFSLLARAGVAQVSSDKTGIGLSSSGSKDSTQFVYGVAAEWSWSPAWALRADLERQRVGYAGQSGDINSFAIGINYRF